MVHPVTVTDELLVELIAEVRGLRSDLQGSEPAPAPAAKKAAKTTKKAAPIDGR